MSSLPKNWASIKETNMSSRVYKAPDDELLWSKAAIYVDGVITNLYPARVSAVPFNRFWPGHQRSLDQTEIAAFTSFEMDTPVQVRIDYEQPIQEIVIRPLSAKIKSFVEAGTVFFTIKEPGGYTVEADGFHEAIHVFANPVENYDVDIHAANTLYFGPGIHNIGKYELFSNQTVYIDEGAVVYGGFHAIDCTNIRIIGRGILDYSTIKENILFDAPTGDGSHGVPNEIRSNTILLEYCENIIIDGITLRDGLFLTLRPVACKNVTIDNVKIIGNWRYNSDGIDIVNCVDVSVRNCFIRSYDDAICLKGFYFPHSGGIFHNEKAYDTVDQCVIENCVVWSDWGQALEIGADICARSIKNAVFRNCDVIHTTCSAMDIQNVDYANIHDITYEDIRVEYDPVCQAPRIQQTDDEVFIVDPASDYLPSLIAIRIFNHYEYSGGGTVRGFIHHITFRNIQVTAPRMPSSILEGYDEAHAVTNVSISGLRFNGKAIMDLHEGRIVNGRHTAVIQIES